MTNSYNDGSHDPETGAYIKPEDRLRMEQQAAADAAVAAAQVSVGTSANDYDPASDPRITHSGDVSVGTSSFDYDGTENISAGSTASYTVTTGAGNTAYDDPAYYASAVDYNVDTMGTTYTVPTTSCECDLTEVLAKLDDLNRKVDHLLEHAHQPLYGTVNLEPPAKVGAGYTV